MSPPDFISVLRSGRTSSRTDRPGEEKWIPVLPSTKQIGSPPPPKPNERPSNHKCLASTVPTIRRFVHARAVNAHSAHESVSLDTLGFNAPSIRQRIPLLPLSPLPQTPHRSAPPSPPTTLAVPPSPSTDIIRPAPTPSSTSVA
nr:unnamed protein product [Spirometra erinaceieuropaei]